MITRSQLLASRLRTLIAAAGLTALLSLTGAGTAQETPQKLIVVSINPYADLAQRVAGQLATVTTLLPPGASPHTFDPSPSQAATLARADLVVMNGGLDSWIVRLVAATAPGTPLLVVTDEIEFIPRQGHDHEGDGHGGSSAGSEQPWFNPHVWLDPTLAAQAVDAIAGALSTQDPENAATYQANAERTRQELALLDTQVAEVLEPVRGAAFVPFHDAWVYFADRYGLDLVVTLEPYPGREPSPRYVAEAVQEVVRSGAKAIFAERQLGSRSAEVVAASAGVAVAVLDPLGGEPGPTTYEELLLENAAVVAATLGE